MFCIFFLLFYICFFSTDPPTTAIYTLSLHDALPISTQPRLRARWRTGRSRAAAPRASGRARAAADPGGRIATTGDRKSTRLNSSHLGISYAVFCLKKKKNKNRKQHNEKQE